MHVCLPLNELSIDWLYLVVLAVNGSVNANEEQRIVKWFYVVITHKFLFWAFSHFEDHEGETFLSHTLIFGRVMTSNEYWPSYHPNLKLPN